MSSAQGVWSGSVPAESTAMNGIRNGTTELPPPVSRERHGSSGASSVASVPTYPQHHHQHNNVNGFPSFRRGGGMRDYGGRRNFGRRGGMRNFDDPRGYSDYYKGPHMSMHGNNFHYSRQWNDYNAPRERRTSMQYRDNQTLSRRSSPVRARYEDNMEEGSTLPRYRAAGTAPSSSISPFAAGQNLTKSDALNVTREMSSTTPQSSPNGGVQSQTDKDVDFKFLLQSALWQTSSPYATVSTPTQEAAPSYKSAGNSPDGNSEAAAAASNFSAAFSNAVSQQSMYAWILHLHEGNEPGTCARSNRRRRFLGCFLLSSLNFGRFLTWAHARHVSSYGFASLLRAEDDTVSATERAPTKTRLPTMTTVLKHPPSIGWLLQLFPPPPFPTPL
ncbi:unnamed protein product [Caenorhabditis auriculariae]|uniref:Uncharacterized protein n=1 Tax=Caenorhabditis auriculariae TaxID=2777116 RepID=A0A8S1GRD9_9PELO|nr:unnamed protein product [Caenorhabditis auriculariae]